VRASNACETLYSQIKRRNRDVGLFPSEESLQRLVAACLVEISKARESGESCLKPQN
jgi:transposase-like protein